MAQTSKEYLKIWFSDIEDASVFFDGNQKHLGEFMVNVYREYAELPTSFSCKLVEKYFKTYLKQINFIKQSKTYGKDGGFQKHDNQQVIDQTLVGSVVAPLVGSVVAPLVPKVKSKKIKDKREIKTKGVFTPPSFIDFENYCKENGFLNIAQRAFKGYSENDWKDSKNNPVLNWKSKLQNVWFNDSNKDKPVEVKKDPLAPRPSSNPINPYDAFR